MRKLTLLAVLSFSFIISYAQIDAFYERLGAKRSFYLRNHWIDSIQRDTSFEGNTRAVPTSDAVQKFVAGRLLSATANSAWSLSGNSIASDKFLGTTNDQDLVFKRNNNEIARFSTNSISIGFNSPALGLPSVSFGAFSGAAVGNYSRLFGSLVGYAIGEKTTILGGDFANAMGDHSIILGGIANQTTGALSTTLSGNSLVARSYGSVVIGQYNDSIASATPGSWVPTDPLLIAGNGTISSSSNAFVLYKNGKLFLPYYKNSIAEDSVLGTDVNGYVKNVPLPSTTNFFSKNGNLFGADAIIGTKDNYNFRFYTNNLERARITNSGNFLIGQTSNSGEALQVTGNLRVNTGTSTLYTASGSNIFVMDGNHAGTFGPNIGNSNNSSSATSSLNFFTDGGGLNIHKTSAASPYGSGAVLFYNLGGNTRIVTDLGKSINFEIGGLGASISADVQMKNDTLISNSTTQFRKGIYLATTTITTNTTLNNTHNTIYVDASSGNVTLTLPLSNSMYEGGSGIVYEVSRVDNSGNTVSIQLSGSDTINGSATPLTISSQNAGYKIKSAGTTKWYAYSITF